MSHVFKLALNTVSCSLGSRLGCRFKFGCICTPGWNVVEDLRLLLVNTLPRIILLNEHERNIALFYLFWHLKIIIMMMIMMMIIKRNFPLKWECIFKFWRMLPLYNIRSCKALNKEIVIWNEFKVYLLYIRTFKAKYNAPFPLTHCVNSNHIVSYFSLYSNLFTCQTP